MIELLRDISSKLDKNHFELESIKNIFLKHEVEMLLEEAEQDGLANG